MVIVLPIFIINKIIKNWNTYIFDCQFTFVNFSIFIFIKPDLNFEYNAGELSSNIGPSCFTLCTHGYISTYLLN